MSILILDTETTGLPSSEWARVIELGAVVLHPHRDYAEINHFHTFMLPVEGVDDRADKALKHSGITRGDLVGAPREGDARSAFYRWLAQHQVTEVFSYNRVFDEGMLVRSGFTLPWAGCVMRMSRDRMPARKKDPTLADAAKHFGVGVAEGLHRALPDARLAAQVFAAIRRGK